MEEKLEKAVTGKEIIKIIDDLEDEAETKDLIKDNKLVFEVEGKCYRMHLPTAVDNRKIEKYRRAKYLELMQDDKYLFKKQWIAKYLAKGIDINKKETEVTGLLKEYKDLLLRLAVIDLPKDIEQLKKQLLENRKVRYEAATEISTLLSDSIENGMLVAVKIYTAYCITEVQEGEEWKPAFESVTDLEDADTPVFTKMLYNLTVLIHPGNDNYELANN